MSMCDTIGRFELQRRSDEHLKQHAYASMPVSDNITNVWRGVKDKVCSFLWQGD